MISDSDPRSIAYARTSQPALAMIERTSSKFALLISNKATLAPSAAIRIAISRPILRPEPVMTTVLPFSDWLIELQQNQFQQECSLGLIQQLYGLGTAQIKIRGKPDRNQQNLYATLASV